MRQRTIARVTVGAPPIGDDYPCQAARPNTHCVWTPGYPAKQCTSYAAWKARKEMGILLPPIPEWDNGGNWGAAAAAAGYTVNHTPAVMSLASFPPGVDGSDPHAGHVAYVYAIVGGVVWLAEYNFLHEFAFDTRPLATTAGISFIHLRGFPPPTPTPPPEEDDVAKRCIFVAKMASGGLAAFVSDGTWYRHIPGATATYNVEADIQNNTGPFFEGSTTPLPIWGKGAPVADLAAFGLPQDAATASLLGLPFP